MILEAINREMDALGVPYQYWEFFEPPDVYAVGELLEDPSTSEDGSQRGTLVVSCWSKHFVGIDPLLDIKDKVRRRYTPDRRIRTDEGAVVIEYSHASAVPSDAEGVARLDITLNYAEWSV